MLEGIHAHVNRNVGPGAKCYEIIEQAWRSDFASDMLRMDPVKRKFAMQMPPKMRRPFPTDPEKAEEGSVVEEFDTKDEDALSKRTLDTADRNRVSMAPQLQRARGQHNPNKGGTACFKMESEASL